MEYKTIVFRDSGKTIDEVKEKFDSRVNQEIQKGYEPVGGVSMQVNQGEISKYYYCQFVLGVIKK